jgi:hypothetical protein
MKELAGGSTIDPDFMDLSRIIPDILVISVCAESYEGG